MRIENIQFSFMAIPAEKEIIAATIKPKYMRKVNTPTNPFQS
jgi:hypothetical protein